MLPDLQPMLADRGLPSGELHGWAVEPKLDGWRASVLADPGLPGGVVVRTRRGHDITGSLPGIDALREIGRSIVLDGELVAGAGRASEFYSVMPVVGRRSGATAPLSFWAFDVLWLDGELLLDRSYADRRAALECLPLDGPCRVLRRFPGADAHDLLDACAVHDVEGIVLKRLSSRYRPGERSRHWRTGQGAGMGRCPRPAPAPGALTEPSRWSPGLWQCGDGDDRARRRLVAQ